MFSVVFNYSMIICKSCYLYSFALVHLLAAAERVFSFSSVGLVIIRFSDCVGIWEDSCLIFVQSLINECFALGY